ncbi:MAG: FRG domain-containing protein [Desulfomonilaceae bacterium]|jgi:hypothetical protein
MPGLQRLEFWSHVHFDEEVRPTGYLTSEQLSQVMNPPKVTKQGFKKTTVVKVRRDIGFPVSTFPNLVRYVAELGSRNTRFNLFFRGQNEDYTDSEGKTKLYPSILRPDANRKQLRRPVIESRFEQLQAFTRRLRANRVELRLSSHLTVHHEYWYSILQHYGLCRTPLLDLTQSLRVAATFALHDVETGTWMPRGYLYVLGMPHLHGCISAFVDDRLTVVKLQNVCPPQALRPHFQEGYLVGRWPRTASKEAYDNFAYWLVGKYLLDNTDGDFFKDDFPPIPPDVLLPREDPFGERLQELVLNVGQTRK